jgi:integrase
MKIVCKNAGINTIIEGYKYNNKNKRRVLGKYPKWEIISSHDLRRTFASNNYGKMPTPLVMSITGHSTEKTFLNYIGKTSIDYAHQIAEYYLKETEKAKKEFNPKVIKNKKVS